MYFINQSYLFTSEYTLGASVLHCTGFIFKQCSSKFDISDNLKVGLFHSPMAVAARSKAWMCSCSLDGIAGSNLAFCMDVCLMYMLCCQVEVYATG
jgi:hypothetical protein